MKFKQCLLFVLTLCLLLSSTGFSLPVSPALPPEEPLIPLAPPAASLVSLNKSSLSLSIGEGALLVATSDYNISWTSSNTAVATVNNGYVVGHSAGTATITVVISDFVTEEGLTSDTCTVTVGSTPIFENGTYFIENMATGKYIDIEGPSIANGAIIQQWSLSGGNSRKWNLVLQNDGYYAIKSYMSLKYMAIATDSTTAIKQYSSITNNAKWSFMKTARGSYVLIAKSSESTLKALATPSTTSGDGVNLTQFVYSNNTSLNDEWALTRMLPLSGYELEYGTDDWESYKNYNNCYSYAINCRLCGDSCFSQLVYYPQQPGDYSGNIYEETTETCLTASVSEDFETYFGVAGKFFEIGRYTPCPVGAYKVALVIDANRPDYHWYRQNSNGLWSHKPGRNSVTNLDCSERLIIDPLLADRNSTDSVPPGTTDYSTFIAYFAVFPWNYVCDNITNPSSIQSTSLLAATESIQSNTISAFSLNNISIGMTKEQVCKILDSEGFSAGSGIYAYDYKLADGTVVLIQYRYNSSRKCLELSDIYIKEN